MSPNEMSLEQVLAIANAKMRAGLANEGIAAFQRAIALAPQRAQTHLALGEAFHSCGRLDEAAGCYRRAIQLEPSLLRAALDLSVAMRELNQIDPAIAALEHALRFSSRDHGIWNDLGILLHKQNHHDQAIAAHLRAIALQPRWAVGWLNLGNVYYKQRRYEDAIEAFGRSAALRPDFLEALTNLANALRANGRLDEAMETCAAALRLKPDSSTTLNVLESILLDRGEIEAAISVFRRALASDPSNATAHFNLGMTLLRKGEFEQGWRECEWRLSDPERVIARPRLTRPAWDGKSDISGKRLVLFTEQGLGDAVQFFRYLCRIPQLNARVILRTAPELNLLAQRCSGIENVETVMCASEPAEYDLQYPLLSLPLSFGTTLENIPQAGAVPYLQSNPERVRFWSERIKQLPRPRIGLAWAGSPEHLNDRNRSIGLSMLAPLANVPRLSFISLQKGPAAGQINSPPPGLSIVDFTPELNDLTDTLDLTAALDLVISVDTAVAHLAGALGKPIWVLLPFVSDWRWLLDRSDSPWYPTMRLLRQPKIGDWQTPIQQMEQALQSFKIIDP